MVFFITVLLAGMRALQFEEPPLATEVTMTVCGLVMLEMELEDFVRGPDDEDAIATNKD